MIDQLDQNEDSFIVVKFLGKMSAAFELHPSNVSPVQMLAAGQVLQEQARMMLIRDQLKKIVQEAIHPEETPPDLVVAKGRILKPNA